MKRRDFITLLGGAAAWPLAARAQQLALKAITLGLLSPVGIAGTSPVFIEALGEFGYQQGRNLTILFRSAKTAIRSCKGWRRSWLV